MRCVSIARSVRHHRDIGEKLQLGITFHVLQSLKVKLTYLPKTGLEFGVLTGQAYWHTTLDLLKSLVCLYCHLC